MNIEECKEVVDRYLEWLRREISVQHLDSGCEITTPFLDRHNDQIQFYANKQNGQIVLSDDGYTASELRSKGLAIDDGASRDTIMSLIRNFGAAFQRENLTLEASNENLGEQVHSYLQAMVALNNLIRIPQRETGLIRRDVEVRAVAAGSYAEPSISPAEFRKGTEHFLRQRHVSFLEPQPLVGRSGLSHSVDFVIPRTSRAPTRYLKLVANPTLRSVKPILFTVADVIESDTDARFYVFLNDVDHEIREQIVKPLKSYRVTPVRWSQREEYAEQLAA